MPHGRLRVDHLQPLQTDEEGLLAVDHRLADEVVDEHQHVDAAREGMCGGEERLAAMLRELVAVLVVEAERDRGALGEGKGVELVLVLLGERAVQPLPRGAAAL